MAHLAHIWLFREEKEDLFLNLLPSMSFETEYAEKWIVIMKNKMIVILVGK